ncbi:MAG: heme-binding domain-containing protein [Anaerolineae bacterium]
MSRKTTLRWVGGLVALGVVLVALGNWAVPHNNPAITETIQWDSPETEHLARTACFDCHSNETKWPWYAFIAPSAFWVTSNVEYGRSAVNFSTYPNLEGSEMARKIRAGEMPPPEYLLLHPEAHLNDEQKAALIAGFEATFRGAELLRMTPAPTPGTANAGGS